MGWREYLAGLVSRLSRQLAPRTRSGRLQDFYLDEPGAILHSPSTILESTRAPAGTNEYSGAVGVRVTTDTSDSGVVKSPVADGSLVLVASQFEKRDRENQTATKIQRALDKHVIRTVT